ncbi:DUF4192 domain-containing protein [Streptomyces sp. CRN 30]|uniref:DUF4192 domain-containing protein n=1 Tax=Streptomyces sp. CRN 30 TaxID=3075613 RepID=UPI002A8340E2|nr:DUF4192 domain-containing protein [Streptomyces sp. CRN 30]
MTNQSGTTGASGNGDIGGRGRPDHTARITHDNHEEEHPITLRTPAELADALPYLLGYRPEDSIVLVALHERDGRGRFGGRARLGIPPQRDDWDAAARQLVHGLIIGSERRGTRPEQMVAYLCREPAKGETGRQVMTRLRSLAQRLRIECGALDVPVVEALCISDGRFWSYCCDDQSCCPPEGLPMGLPGTSVLAAAATYAGIQVRGTLSELHVRLRPWEGAAVTEQETALDTVGMALISRILDEDRRAGVAEETLELAERAMARLADAPPVTGTTRADRRDDGLLSHDEAARLIHGLQDRTTRDRAAEWMEGDEAPSALRLWRALARRCVGSYGEHAAAPLTLAGWVAWSTGDELEAREALAMALAADTEYLFARLLHQACNEGLDPETIRNCLRTERGNRGDAMSEPPACGEPAAFTPMPVVQAAATPVPVAPAVPAPDSPSLATHPTPPVVESPLHTPHPTARRRPRTCAADPVSSARRQTATPSSPPAPESRSPESRTPTGRRRRTRGAARGPAARRNASAGEHSPGRSASEE